MKEYSREWFLAQSEAASRVVAGWPESVRKNLVLASANLPVSAPTKATIAADTPTSADKTIPQPDVEQS
jgi:hypothetical protein